MYEAHYDARPGLAKQQTSTITVDIGASDTPPLVITAANLSSGMSEAHIFVERIEAAMGYGGEGGTKDSQPHPTPPLPQQLDEAARSLQYLISRLERLTVRFGI